MVKIEVESVSLTCGDDSKGYIYSYYLTKAKNPPELDKKLDIWGIEVLSNGVGFDYCSSNCISDFTTSKEYALKTIKYLADNKVSPLHFVDILVDEVDQNDIHTDYTLRCL